jgi:hypothetical protein
MPSGNNDYQEERDGKVGGIQFQLKSEEGSSGNVLNRVRQPLMLTSEEQAKERDQMEQKVTEKDMD